MADSDKTVSYGVTADASPFEAGMQRAADSARGAASSIDANFRKVQDAFSAVQKQLLLLAGIVAGGSFFKEAISASNQLTGETMKLSKALGINAEEAGTLRTALEDIGSSGDDYVETFTKFARQLRTNEEGLKSYGLQTRDANGNLRDSKELFSEALSSVGQYKAGLDQNTYAQTVFGKSIDNVMKLQKLNNDVMEEAKRKNQELGLVVTKDNVEASKAYKLAMNDVGDVLTAVKKVIGDAVMPVFTELAQYFASTGPAVVAVFKGAMMGLLVAFEVVRGAVKTVAAVVFEAFSLIVDGAGMIGDVFAKLFKGDFSGAYESAKQVGSRVAQAFSGAFASFLDAGNDIPDAIAGHAKRLYGSGGGTPEAKGGEKRMGEFGKDTNGDGQMAAFERELAEKRYLYEKSEQDMGSVRQFSKQQEADFWREKVNMTAAGSRERMQVEIKAFNAERGILKDKVDAQRAALDTEAAQFRNNVDARQDVLNRELDFVKSRFGEESKEYQEVQKKIVEAKRQAAEQQKQIDMLRVEAARNAQLAELRLAEQQSQLERDLHVITTQELLAREKEVEDRRYQIAVEGVMQRLQIAEQDKDKNRVEIERLNREKEALEQQHQLRMGEIRAQSTRDAQQYSIVAYGQMQSGFANSIARMMQGASTLSGFIRNMFQSVTQAVTGAIAQMAAKWIMEVVVMKAVSAALALFEINTNAARAGAAAAASAAETPVVGWLMAPAAAAATFALASGYAGGLPSAAGGYDIPGTINPIVQAHANEMVLPAKQADVIRRMADDDAGGGRRPAINIHNNFQLLDGRDVRRVLIDNNGAVMEAVRKATKDFR